MLSKRSKTPTKSTSRTARRSPTPIQHVTSTMVGDPGSENSNNLSIALQLAEHHKKEAYLYRGKCQILEAKLSEKEKLSSSMSDEVDTLRKQNYKLLNKYKKLKVKHKQQAEAQKNSYPQHQHESPLFNRTQGEPENSLIEASPSVSELQQELWRKTQTISLLCTKVQECETNTLQIFKLVSVLEQRVQELSMDNSLLRGVIRHRRQTYDEEESQDVSLD